MLGETGMGEIWETWGKRDYYGRILRNIGNYEKVSIFREHNYERKLEIRKETGELGKRMSYCNRIENCE